MLKVCEDAVRQSLPVYFYGSTETVIEKLCASLLAKFPGLRIAGAEPSKFRRLSPDEQSDLVMRIRTSGASVVFVGLGCPRQEVFAFELLHQVSIPILAVGAAFPFHAGTLPQAPKWMQDHGLEWLFRFGHEPMRLWKRYIVLNPYYVFLIALESLGWKFSTVGTQPLVEQRYG
jgi:exopolysaccharide biosynthesis WecB/TagA/CpsF family protein